MIKFSSEFSDGSIKATSEYCDDPNELWNGFFDFALVGSSWDKRCTAVTRCENLTAQSTVIIKPFVTSSSPILDEHNAVIFKFCHAQSKDLHVVESSTSNLAESLRDVQSHFWAAISHVDRKTPARIFVDISTCPRYFSLAILGEAFRSGLVAEIVLGYSEGKYPRARPSYKDLEELSFTDGPFQAVPVPGFFGEFEPSKGKFFLVSFGFDGWKTLNLLIRKEPERVAALLATKPNGSDEYEQRALAANAALIERFGTVDELIIKSDACDAVGTWRKITDSNLENFDAENIYYLCSGNKPHSVALALRAIVLGNPTLLYNQVSQHLPVEVNFAGVYWKYSIRPTAGTVFG